MSFVSIVGQGPSAPRGVSTVLLLEGIVGVATEAPIAEALHRLEHEGAVEYLTLTEADTQRHRLRAFTDRGSECAIALPRTQHLSNGAVLLLDQNRAVVVRMQETQWLALQPFDAQAAMQLGYFAGNMHWKVEFAGKLLRIAVQGPLESYVDRLAHLLQNGRVVRCIEQGQRGPAKSDDN
jgi:urease accessory protein